MLKIKKNSDCEKRIVIVNLYRTVTVEYYVSVNGSMWLSLKHAIIILYMHTHVQFAYVLQPMQNACSTYDATIDF